ncbi:MAG: replicative DNA helicase [Planctomycetes bacterium]|nr:replicative DNA helicase [Planctomycetota bacterium]
METNRLPPHSTEAEQGTLGAMLLDPDIVIDVLATLRPDDFYEPVHQEIFRAIADLSTERSAIDVLTVTQRLRDDDQVNAAGGSAYIAEVAVLSPTSANVLAYAGIVRDKAVHRAVGKAGVKIAQFGTEESLPAAEVLEKAEQQILALSRQSAEGKPQHIYEIGGESYERYVALHEADDTESLLGLRTGFPDLDQLITGLEPGSLTIVAARPSLGKTSLALSIACNVAADQGKNVAIFSLEMTKQSLMDRIVSRFLGVETWKLKKGKLSDEQFRQLGPVFDKLKEHPIYIDDDFDASMANLRSKARRLQMEHGLDLLIIDYLQLIEVTDRSAGENRTQQVSHISRSLKTLGRELDCPILALSQLSRNVEQRQPPIPVLSDLRESGSIEQDAALVLVLYREGIYNPDCDHPDLTDVFVRKHRNGATGRVSLHFDAERMAFRNSRHVA